MTQRARVGRLVAAVSVRKSLGLAVVATIVVTVAVATAGLMQIRSVADRGKAIYSKGVLPTAEVGHLRQLVWQARFESLSGTTATDADTQAMYYEQFAKTVTSIDSTVSTFRQHDLSQDQFAAINDFTTAWGAYLTAREEGHRLLDVGDWEAWERNRQENLTPATEAALSALDALDSSSQQAAATSLDEANKAVSSAQLVIIAMMVAGVVLALVVMMFLSRVTEGVATETSPGSSGAERRRAVRATDRTQQHTLKQELHQAIVREGLNTRFEPVVDLMSNRPVGVEMTLAWDHPGNGLLQSTDLLRLAEEEDLGAEIGEWALRQACQQIGVWLREGNKLWMTVNVTAERLARTEFVGDIAMALDKHKIPAAHLMIKVPSADFETGETGARGHHTTAVASGAEGRAQAMGQNLAKLRSMGIRVAIEHSGGEVSSLSNLRRVPLNLVSVDRAEALGPGATELTAFAHQIGAEISVRGLVDQNEAEAVRSAGCRYGQGLLISEPVTAQQMGEYLKRLRSQRV